MAELCGIFPKYRDQSWSLEKKGLKTVKLRDILPKKLSRVISEKTCRRIMRKLKKTAVKQKLKMKASFTIEAAVVVPICMVILVSVVLVAFYLHDNVVLKAAAPSLVLESAADLSLKSENPWNSNSESGDGNDNTVIEYDANTYFSRRLIVLKNITFEASEKNDGIVFSDSGEYGTDLGMAATILNTLGNVNESVEISHLMPRKKLIKYKIICEAAGEQASDLN